MTIIAMPDDAFRDAAWTLVQPAQVNVSEFTGRRQVMTLPGAARWTVQANHVPIIGAAAFKPWRSFLTKLRGQANTFRMLAGEEDQRSGSNPTASAAAAGATSLTLNGLPISSTELEEGDSLTVRLAAGGEQLVTLSADLVTNGSGVGVASFQPLLRDAVTAGAEIETVRPWCLMALDDAASGWSVGTGQIYAIQITAAEAY